jgi:hypothetical protein
LKKTELVLWMLEWVMGFCQHNKLKKTKFELILWMLEWVMCFCQRNKIKKK